MTHPEGTTTVDIPAHTTIHLDTKDSRGKRYAGDFQVHVPTIGDRIEMGKVLGRLMGDTSRHTPAMAFLCEVIAYLAVTVDSAPEWWAACDQGQTLYDSDPVIKLWKEVRAHEDRFLGGDAHAGAEDVGGHAGSAPGPDAASGDGAVGGDVQAPAERSEVLVSAGG